MNLAYAVVEWTRFGRFRADAGRFGTCVARVWAKFDKFRTTIDQIWAEIDQPGLLG